MCGIVGILGSGPAAPLLVDALKRLEYRGYDSAGVATLEDGHLTRCRAEGKLRNLEERLARQPLSGHSGIGHTRWATHGAPTERNAHPHATDRLALVHNGIIENFRELREELEQTGVVFATDTDTEVVAQLISRNLEKGMGPAEAVRVALGRVEGAFALAILFDGDDDLMIGARRGSPLAIGYGDGEMFLGSDAIALAPFTDQVTYLEDGDWAILTRAGATIFDASGVEVERPMTRTMVSSLLVDKGNYRHFMTKEIHEQPDVVGRTLGHYLDFAASESGTKAGSNIDFKSLDRLSITACGTAYYAGLVAKYWFERFARLPVDIDIASEFRYREQPLTPNGLSIVVSQSGETADTLASLRYAKAEGQRVAAIVNVQESTIARESDFILPTLAGPEIGVASTKAFTCQLSALASLAVAAGKARGHLSRTDEERLVRALSEVPRLMSQALKLEPQLEALARDLSKFHNMLYLGRGTNFPIALEGALKLKE
ncbi:MAG: glutamine--fructose-6-phosphate transaminase (isomerizing), partial [Bauldia sp.]|nr:glutamine--fructose-6-phosphate transaminase (isomerizing) [Bauldia sp.]